MKLSLKKAFESQSLSGQKLGSVRNLLYGQLGYGEQSLSPSVAVGWHKLDGFPRLSRPLPTATIGKTTLSKANAQFLGL